MIVLKTERTVIRDHREEDLPSHHELFSDGKAMYYLQDIATHSLEESRENLRTAMSEIGRPERKYYFLRIEGAQMHEHIGEIGYTVTDFTPAGKLVEVGYFLRPEHWGKGYAAEALSEVIRFAFAEGGVVRISCGCLKDNVASERVMQKCGLIKEADRKAFAWHDGKLKDRVEYRLLKWEWEPSSMA